jgi:hypothetical protein
VASCVNSSRQARNTIASLGPLVSESLDGAGQPFILSAQLSHHFAPIDICRRPASSICRPIQVGTRIRSCQVYPIPLSLAPNQTGQPVKVRYYAQFRPPHAHSSCRIPSRGLIMAAPEPGFRGHWRPVVVPEVSRPREVVRAARRVRARIARPGHIRASAEKTSRCSPPPGTCSRRAWRHPRITSKLKHRSGAGFRAAAVAGLVAFVQNPPAPLFA